MRVLITGAGWALSALGLLAGCAGQDSPGNDRETVLDQVVTLQDSLITGIPPVARLCERAEVAVQRVNTGNCELYAEQEGQGPALVLIHGGPGSTHHTFHPWLSEASDFARVIYYDQRGTGLSDHDPGPSGYSVDQAVANLEALRVSLGLDTWILLGHSYGGFLAQYYTIRHPEHVAGLGLVGASTGMWVRMGQTRQYSYLSIDELDRMEELGADLRVWAEENGLSRQERVALSIYNNFMNGDWKRQNFYRPSPEQMARKPSTSGTPIRTASAQASAPAWI